MWGDCISIYQWQKEGSGLNNEPFDGRKRSEKKEERKKNSLSECKSKIGNLNSNFSLSLSQKAMDWSLGSVYVSELSGGLVPRWPDVCDQLCVALN